jgi:HK97 family phage major capsid protein
MLIALAAFFAPPVKAQVDKMKDNAGYVIQSEVAKIVTIESKEAYKLDNAEYKSSVADSGPSFGSAFIISGIFAAILGIVFMFQDALRRLNKKQIAGLAALALLAILLPIVPYNQEVITAAFPAILFMRDLGAANGNGDVRPLKELSDRELRDMGNKAIERMRQLYADKRAGKEITQDQEAQVDKWELETDAVEKEVEARKLDRSLKSLEASGGPKIPGTDTESDEKYDPKFQPTQREFSLAMKKAQARNFEKKFLTVEERKIVELARTEEEAFVRLFANGLKPDGLDEQTRFIIGAHEKRAQSTTTTAGGYTIPQGFIPRIIIYLKYISAFFEEQVTAPNATGAIDIFDVYRTDSGNDLPVPTNDDTGNTGELLAENADASSSSADLTFGQKTFKAYKFSSKMIKTSTELMQDTGVDLVDHIARQFGTRLGRVLNTYFTTGTGSSQPSGIQTGLTLGKLGGTTGTISFPEIIDLVHSVDPSYRKSPSARFMLNDSILKLLKKVTVGASTTNARPLWAPGWNESAPPTIDGYQYLINNDMDSTFASGKKVMLFGDMKTFGIRFVNNYRLMRLSERYAEFDQTAWVGFMRADSRLLNTSGIKYYAGT